MKCFFLAPFFLLIIFTCTKPSFSQDSTERHLSLRSVQLSGLDLLYSKERSEKKYTRIIIGGLKGDADWDQRDSVNGRINRKENDQNFGLRLGVGLARVKPLTEKIAWICGPELSVNFNFTRQSYVGIRSNNRVTQKGFHIRPGIGYMLGLRYSITEETSISIQAIPMVSSRFSYSKDRGFVNRYNMDFSIARFALGLNFQLPSSKKEE